MSTPNTKMEIMESLQDQQNGKQSTSESGTVNPMSAFRTRQFEGMGQAAARAVGTPTPSPSQSQSQATGFVSTETNDEPAFRSYEDIYNVLSKQNEEQKKIDEKKRKRDEMFAAIGDGISALSNLYFTTKGAPNSYNANNTMSDRTREMYDKIDKDRRDNFDHYLNQQIQLAKADNENSWRLNELGYKKGRDKIADDKYNAEKEYKRERDKIADDFRKQEIEFRKNEAERNQKNTERAQEASEKYHNAMAKAAQDRASNGSGRSNQYAREIALGDGSFARIPHARFNPSNIGMVFDALPEDVKERYGTEPVIEKGRMKKKKGPDGKYMKDASGNYIYETKPKKMTNDEMLHIIGQYVGSDKNVRDAWIKVGGEFSNATNGNSSGTDWSQYEVGNGGASTDWSQYEDK